MSRVVWFDDDVAAFPSNPQRTVPAVPVLSAHRLRLRSWTTQDIDRMTQLYADEDVARYMPLSASSPLSMDCFVQQWQRYAL